LSNLDSLIKISNNYYTGTVKEVELVDQFINELLIGIDRNMLKALLEAFIKSIGF